MGLEMVVQVVEWGWIYDMDVVEVVVVVEVYGRDSMESVMEDIEGNIKYVEDFPNKDLANHVSILVLGLRWPRFPRRECIPISLRWMLISLKL